MDLTLPPVSIGHLVLGYAPTVEHQLYPNHHDDERHSLEQREQEFRPRKRSGSFGCEEHFDESFLSRKGFECVRTCANAPTVRGSTVAGAIRLCEGVWFARYVSGESALGTRGWTGFCLLGNLTPLPVKIPAFESDQCQQGK
jgi:hypothetical protein